MGKRNSMIFEGKKKNRKRIKKNREDCQGKHNYWTIRIQFSRF